MNDETPTHAKFLRIISLILALSLGLNLILILKRTDVFPSKHKLITENKTLSQQMYQYKTELNKFKGISLEIDKTIKVANLKIEEKEKQIARLRLEKKSMEKEKEKENQNLVYMADSITNLYLNVIDSLLVEREKSKVINNKIETLEDIIANLNTKLGYAAFLEADNMKVSPAKVSMGGKSQPTAMAALLLLSWNRSAQKDYQPLKEQDGIELAW